MTTLENDCACFYQNNNRITPSMSLTSPGVSQWTVNESSFGTQTMQTDNNWSVQHGDSFDSCKSYSIGKF